MDTQDKFARRLAARLEANLDALPPHVLAKLEQSRETALARSRPRFVPVGGGALALHWLHLGRNKLAALSMASLVVLTLAAAQYRAIQTTADEAADIDETILSGQAPVQSYLDAGFAAVLRSGLALRPATDDR